MEETATNVQHKKRLSRKEQKVRKKQRLKETPAVKDLKEAKPSVIELDEEDPSYLPTPLPPANSQLSAKKLGKWFPKATLHKTPVSYSNTNSPPDVKASILLFYQYKEPVWPESRVEYVHKYMQEILTNRKHIGGRIRVASEGINATISSVDTEEASAATTLRHFCRDLKHLDSIFENTDFKFLDGLSADRHFKDCKILPVQELVFYGIKPDEAPLEAGGVHLPAKDFHQKLQEKDTVVIDVRNHYEAAIGRFDGQQDGASYIDPKMRKSTDFVRWLGKEETQEQLKDKQVLMFCTGGVRCERASAYLNKTMGDQIKGTFQLQGGIERYLKEFGKEGFWRGKNFVFDKREAADGENPNGDGGVLKKSGSEHSVDAKCCGCERPWDRYVGKRKCATCGVPVLMCDECMSNQEIDARCPLCVEENVTITADRVQYMENGTSVSTLVEGKAAASVLKWGGGHGKKKFRKPCRFGADCVRSDCLFQHPKDKRNGELENR